MAGGCLEEFSVVAGFKCNDTSFEGYFLHYLVPVNRERQRDPKRLASFVLDDQGKWSLFYPPEARGMQSTVKSFPGRGT